MSRLTPSLLVLDKGLDLQTAKILAPEGSVFDSLNYEQVDFQGQKRIDGYARYDGTVLPAFNDYYKIAFTPTGCWTGFPEDTNTNLFVDDKLWAVAIKNANLDGDEAYIQILDHSIDVTVGDILQVNGSSIGPITSIEQGKNSGLDIDDHYNLLLDLTTTIRTRVTTLPEPTAGLHWFQDRLYAVAGIQTFKAGMLLSGTLPDVCAGTVVDYTLTLNGGVAPTTITKLSGPTDMTISSTGQVEWNNTLPGIYTVTAEAVDSIGNSDQWEDTFQVVALTWNFTTWQSSAGYTSPFGTGQVFWSSFWNRYVSLTGPGRKISTDGITWTQEGTGDFFNGAENPSNNVMALATGNAIYSSSDGGTTVTLQSNKVVDNSTLQFVNGGFLGISGGGVISGTPDAVTWTYGPSFMALVGVGPEFAYMDNLGKYVFVSGDDGRVATSTFDIGPYSASAAIPAWGGNKAIGLTYVPRLQKLFIWRNDGVILETEDLLSFTTRLNVPGLSISSMIDVPEMNALIAVGSGGQPSTYASTDGGLTWSAYTGLNSYRILSWSPALSRLVAVGQNQASYANASCPL